MGERLSFPCRLPRDGTGLRDDTSFFGPETNPVPQWQKVRPNRGQLRKHKANIGNHGKLMGTFLGACPKRTMGKKSRGFPLPGSSGLEGWAESSLPILHRVLKKNSPASQGFLPKKSQIDKRKGILQISWHLFAIGRQAVSLGRVVGAPERLAARGFVFFFFWGSNPKQPSGGSGWGVGWFRVFEPILVEG